MSFLTSVYKALLALGIPNKKQVLNLANSGNRVVLFGDSITAQNFKGYNMTSVSCSGGVGTFTISGTGQFVPGCPVYITATAVDANGNMTNGGMPEGLHGLKTITGGSGTTWTFDATGVPDSSGIGTAVFPRVYCLWQYQDPGYFVWGNCLSNKAFELVGFSASTGRYTQEALARIGEVTQYNADIAFVLLGTNDTSASESVVPLATAMTNMLAIWNTFLSRGTKVVAITIPPQGGSTPSSTTTVDRVVRFNQFIRDTVASTPGMYLLDWHKVLVNPVSSPVGQPLSGTINSGDGLHPTTKGAYLGGKALAALVPSIFAPVDRLVQTNADNVGATGSSNSNILDSAPWVSSGATPDAPVTGTLPTGWRALRQGTPAANPAMSVVARADGYGYDIRCDMTASNLDDGIFVLTTSGVNSTLQSRLPNAPFKLSLLAAVKVTGLAAGKLYSVNSSYNVTVGGNSMDVAAMLSVYTNANEVAPEDWSGVLSTPPATFTTKPSAIVVTAMRAFCSTAGAAFAVQVGRLSLRIG